MLLDKLKNLFSVSGDASPDLSSLTKDAGQDKSKMSSTGDLRSREIALFGDDILQQQRLYEKWVCKESWLLQSEGIPLLLGKDPQVGTNGMYADDYKRACNELREHAQRCVEQNLLPVVNREGAPETWEVKPVDLYRWASVSRITVSESLVRLIEFVIQTVKPSPDASSMGEIDTHNAGGAHAYTETYHNHRESVLGAALAVLARYPEKCKNSKGRIRSELIVNIINEKGAIWFGDEKSLLSRTAMQDLLDKYLKTIE